MNKVVSEEDLNSIIIPSCMNTEEWKKEWKAFSQRQLEVDADINKGDDTRNNILGRMGEAFTDNMCWVFADRFYIYGCSLRSYTITKQYGTKEYSPRGGLDRYVCIIDELGDRYNLAIEVKNWMKMKYITDETFRDEILDRYKDCSENDYKILAITRNNIPLIEDRCEKNGIRILPIENHITPEMDREGMEYALYFFYKEFSDLLNEIMYSDRNIRIRKLKRCGLKVDMIADIYGLTERQIWNIVGR